MQLKDYKAAEQEAKTKHLCIWQYGDITEDDAREFGMGRWNRLVQYEEIACRPPTNTREENKLCLNTMIPFYSFPFSLSSASVCNSHPDISFFQTGFYYYYLSRQFN